MSGGAITKQKDPRNPKELRAAYNRVKRDNKVLMAIMSFTWSAIAFGVIIGLIGVFG